MDALARVRPRLTRSHVTINPGYEVWNQNSSARRTWNDNEVQALLAIWADASVQRQLLGTVRNTAIFNKILQELLWKGYQHDTKQCREKLKELKKYKEVVDGLRCSGAGVDSDDDYEEGGGLARSTAWWEGQYQLLYQRCLIPLLHHSGALTSRLASQHRMQQHPSWSKDHMKTLKELNHAILLAINCSSQPLLLQNLLRTHLDKLSLSQSSLDFPQCSLDLSQSSLDHLPKDPLKDSLVIKEESSTSRMGWKDMQNMVDAFVASEEKARTEFLDLEKKKIEMEKEQAKNEERREDCFLCIMHDVILMMPHPAPVPQPFPQGRQWHVLFWLARWLLGN